MRNVTATIASYSIGGSSNSPNRPAVSGKSIANAPKLAAPTQSDTPRVDLRPATNVEFVDIVVFTAVSVPY